MIRTQLWASWLPCTVLLAACGGGGGSGGSTQSGPPPVPNMLTVTVDQGPTGLTNTGYSAANTLYATVIVCTPGSMAACQTIDHVQVDTGSVGVQILAEVLNGSATPTEILDPATNAPLRECVQFADGYSWGSMVVADVTIGGRTVTKLPLHLIGDVKAGAAPAGCVKGPPENTVAKFGANGVLGVGNFLQDCGQYCVTQTALSPYYACPLQTTTCQLTTVALASQMQNPVWLFASDNNGIVVQLPGVTAQSAPTLSGTLYFGIGTQANNSPGSATFYTLDGYGDLVTLFGTGPPLTSSFIDSGSNAYFFNSSITTCTSTGSVGFYCPASPASVSATIQGANGATHMATFTVDNATTLFAAPATAYPTLAGPNTAANAQSNSFDWGLPFFYGLRVYVLFEGYIVGATTGPAIAF